MSISRPKLHKARSVRFSADKGAEAPTTNARSVRFSAQLKLIMILALIFLSASLTTACLPQATPNPTAEAKIASFAQTATQRAGGESEARSTAESAQVNATATRQSAAATQVVKATVIDESMRATATAIAPIIAELPFYSVDPTSGAVGWIHPPVTITVTEYHGVGYANQFPTVIARDFVMVADITWNSTYESAGCGFVLRASGDEDFPSQYMVIATGLSYGHVFFGAMVEGKPANFSDFYANDLDPDYQWESGTTNRLAVVGKGNMLYIYSNYLLLGEVDVTAPPAPLPKLPAKPQKPADLDDKVQMDQYEKALAEYEQAVASINARYAELVTEYQTADSMLEEGFVGLVGINESGDTTCRFDNAWLWLIDS